MDMRCIVVTGIGRTGTSAIAGMLHNLGISMGKKLKVSTNSNPKGYFEDMDYIDATFVRPPPARIIAMKKWANKRVTEGNYIWGFKFSAFIGNSKITLDALNEANPNMQVKIIRCIRDHEEAARSTAAKLPRDWLALDDFRNRIKKNHIKNETFFSSWLGPTLVIDYKDTINCTQLVLNSLIDFCFKGTGYFPTQRKQEEAYNFIDPKLKRF